MINNLNGGGILKEFSFVKPFSDIQSFSKAMLGDRDLSNVNVYYISKENWTVEHHVSSTKEGNK